ncbi:MAG TPA: phosphorylated adapter RNA export RNA-binding domain-containing protein [Polyangiaceae bacterium]|jgi:hypothetical protein|nr:phosphorylated adapter RNA export RNA-binding domain-containing protein [Polyangiaceae bacterium]
MATEETVNTIAKALGEVEEQPTTQITGVVRVLGEQTSLGLLEETQRIEQSGGMLLPDGSRRRTPGGVFFFLARQKLSHDDKVAIFRPVKPARPAQSVPEATRFPRRRVIEVAPSKEPPARPRGGFIPPGLPLAARRVRARETIQNALAALPPDDQNSLLLEVLAELYERRGVRIPEPSPPAPRPSASEPPPPAPPSQRPIPVPAPAQAAAPEPPEEEPPSSEPAPRKAGGAAARPRAGAAAARGTTKKRA